MSTPHGEAYALTTLIYSKGVEDLSEVIAQAVEAMGITDDAKADLYSLIEEGITASTKFFEAVTTIEKAIISNKRRFQRC